MRAYLTDPSTRAVYPGLPIPHVWLGTSVEDQATADARIPHLLATPAAVRFVSAEPLLGPVDLGRWLATAHVTCKACRQPFWLHSADPCEHAHRGAWTLACPHCGDCRCQATTTGGDTFGPPYYWTGPQKGRFMVTHQNTTITPGIDWVIVGGESGPGARPMHPDWARSLRDQCQAAGVAFHFKQWGEYVGGDRQSGWVTYQNGAWTPDCDHDFGDGCAALRDGKARSGRLLDGREWNEMPGAAS